jgi:hypothetical protein
MTTIRTQSPSKFACLLAGLVMCGAGSAVASTWTFNNTASNTQGPVTATASAWANTVGSANVQLGSAFLTYNNSSGLGIRHADNETTQSPQHAADNDGRIETFLFSFAGDKVNLTSASFGWVQNDSDYSVYAYTGAGVGSVDGLTYANLTANSWSLVGHYDSNNSTGSKPISSSIFSSYWLIGAYNGTGSGMDTSKDYFKLASVTGSTCTNVQGGNGCGGGTPGGVPEPGTILLMGAGLLGLTRMSRRKAA